jgi:transcriptional regulator with GAF, ATPase, and Fis domain
VFLSESGTTAFGALKELLLEIAQERELAALLPFIVRRMAERSESVACARIWLLGPGDSCADCRNAPVCTSREQCLHLAASAMRPSGAGVQVDTQLSGAFRRVPIGALEIGTVISERRAVIAEDASPDPDIADPNWVRAEGIQSFAGQPLLYRDNALGVLGVYLRGRLAQPDVDVLGLIAKHAAAAIAGARAFDEIARRQLRLERENEYLREVVTSHDDFTTIVGSSPAIYHLKRQIDLVAPTDTTVLVSGESGTGKELVAEAIHRRSRRAGESFVRVNCAVIPEELYESELFGHTKGAFSGALRDRVGRFEAAEGGTLFLDEVGEIPYDLQGKLLRVLEEGAFERVGETRSRQADVRIVAATHRELTRDVTQGRFRQDFYFRLNVFPLELPALRERREDVALIALHLVTEICRRMHREPLALEPDDLRELEAYDWPGNVRELRNVLERAIVGTPHSVTRLVLPRFAAGGRESVGRGERADFMPRAVRSRTVVPEADVRRFEKENLLAALEATGGRVYGRGGAADLLGVKPTTLASRLKKLGIAPRS